MATNAINLVSYLEHTKSKLEDTTLPDINRTAFQLICEMLEQSLEQTKQSAGTHAHWAAS
jgi:hypothetical protein